MLKRFGTPAPGDEAVQIVRLTKSGGCVDRDEGYMRQFRQAQIRNYFFGGSKNSLSPFTHSGVEYDAIKVLKLVEGMYYQMHIKLLLQRDDGSHEADNTQQPTMTLSTSIPATSKTTTLLPLTALHNQFTSQSSQA